MSDDVRAIVEAEHAVTFPVNGVSPTPLIRDSAPLDELIRLYRALPERHRETAVAVFRAAADALSGRVSEEKSRE